MSVVSSYTPRKGRNVELVLVVAAVAIVLLAYLNVELATNGEIPAGTLTLGRRLPRRWPSGSTWCCAGGPPTPTR